MTIARHSEVKNAVVCGETNQRVDGLHRGYEVVVDALKGLLVSHKNSGLSSRLGRRPIGGIWLQAPAAPAPSYLPESALIVWGITQRRRARLNCA